MDSKLVASRLLRGGFTIREASDIMGWIAPLYGWEGIDYLVDLEEIAQTIEIDASQQPYYNELLYWRRKERERQEKRASYKKSKYLYK